MKRMISVLFAVVVFSWVLCFAAAADIITDAKFEDGFSDNSGKLSVNVTNDSEIDVLSGVTVSVSLPDGVSTASPSVSLGDLAPGESAAKDFMLNFESPSIFSQYKFIFIFGALAFVLLFAVALALLRRSKRGAALVLAVALLPAAAFASRAVMMRRQEIKINHDGEEYSISILVTAEKAESEMTFGQTGEPAKSRPLKSTRPTDPYADYNTPKVSRGSIKDGAVALGDSEICVGTGGMMFLGEEIDYYEGKDILAENSVAHIADRLASIDDWARENGIDFYVLICPNKSTVYDDLLPGEIQKAAATNRTLLVDHLKANTSVRFVDAADAVSAGREKFGDALYFKYDTHWNQLAGYLAYAELMKAIRADRPSAKLYPADMFNVAEYETYMKDNAYYLGYYDDFTDFGPVYSLKSGPEAEMTESSGNQSQGQFRFCYHWETGFREDLQFVCFESVNPDAPRAYVLRDSFSIAMFPFLKESFSTSAFDWSFTAKAQDILARGTDVLILEVVERSIHELASARIIE